jgi:hypothetical protein
MFAESENDIILQTAVSVSTKFWDRLENLATGECEFPMVIDSLFRMPQMIVKLATLQELEHALTVWLESPTAELEFEVAG